MIKYVQYLIITWIITSHLELFTGMSNYLPEMKKSKSMNHIGTGGLQSFKVKVRLSFNYYVEEAVNRVTLKSLL